MDEEKDRAADSAVFDRLTPNVVMKAVELSGGPRGEIRLDGTWSSFPSYINRVYGLKSEEGIPYVAKFYRPGRWTCEAIEEEHQFLRDCAEDELPVVPPLSDTEGETLRELELEDEGISYPFALFPLRSGRLFDVDNEEAYLRLGSLIGRLHRVGKVRPAPSRLSWTPALSRTHLAELLESGQPVASQRREFSDLVARTLDIISPLFEGQPLFRIHGDCHRGNILERPGEGLLLIDFDDMAMGPAIQDLWLLLPGRLEESSYQFMLLKEGYDQFSSLPEGQEQLVEPLRFMRMLHFLTWSAHQRQDRSFSTNFPDWGSEAFWIKEIADFRDQYDQIRASIQDEIL
jgi:Ser/Thr protein kinase RdoA (MazF antagonist)